MPLFIMNSANSLRCSRT